VTGCWRVVRVYETTELDSIQTEPV